MLIDTHKAIAHEIYETVKTEFGIELHYKRLLEGSVAPDSIPGMILIPHTFGRSMRRLKKQLWKLCHWKNPVEHSGEFAYSLGIVIHYLCDFFCTAHNDPRYRNVFTHLQYERELAGLYEESVVMLQELPYVTVLKTEDLYRYIENVIVQRYKEYSCQNRSPIQDLEFAFCLARGVACLITSQYLPAFMASDRIA